MLLRRFRNFSFSYLFLCCYCAAEADEAQLRELCSELLGPPRAVGTNAAPRPGLSAPAPAAAASGAQQPGDGVDGGGGGNQAAAAAATAGRQQESNAAPGGWQQMVLGIDKRELLRKEVRHTPQSSDLVTSASKPVISPRTQLPHGSLSMHVFLVAFHWPAKHPRMDLSELYAMIWLRAGVAGRGPQPRQPAPGQRVQRVAGAAAVLMRHLNSGRAGNVMLSVGGVDVNFCLLRAMLLNNSGRWSETDAHASWSPEQ